MAYTQINLNPENKRVGDCTVRAIAAGTGKSWEDIYAALALEGYLLHDMPTANYVWGSYLRRHSSMTKMLPKTKWKNITSVLWNE